jgi:hypothetical protein
MIDKAHKLIDSFFDLKSYKMDDNGRMSYPLAKQCAILHCDKQLEEWNKISDLKSKLFINDILVTVVDRICHWNEIKRELENL